MKIQNAFKNFLLIFFIISFYSCEKNEIIDTTSNDADNVVLLENLSKDNGSGNTELDNTFEGTVYRNRNTQTNAYGYCWCDNRNPRLPFSSRRIFAGYQVSRNEEGKAFKVIIGERKFEANITREDIRPAQVDNELSKLYILNSGNNDVLLTTSLVERNNAINTLGYRDRSDRFRRAIGTNNDQLFQEIFIYNKSGGGRYPIYRLKTPSGGAHFFTIDRNEASNAIAQFGFILETNSLDESIIGYTKRAD